MTNKLEPDFTLNFEQRDDYLYAFVSGPRDNLVVSKKFWEQVHAKAVELKSKAVMIEEDFPNQVATIEMFELAQVATELFKGFGRVAHVDKQASDMDLNKFGETVGVNRGFNVRAFNKLQDAEKWLRN